MKVTVSGGFDPIHKGHIALFKEAKKLGDELVVILNCDKWLDKKKGKAFMSQEDRKIVIEAIKYVDSVYIHESDDYDVVEALKEIKPDIFANGGDRYMENTPELDYCMEQGIRAVFGVGGNKIESSSNLLKKYAD